MKRNLLLRSMHTVYVTEQQQRQIQDTHKHTHKCRKHVHPVTLPCRHTCLQLSFPKIHTDCRGHVTNTSTSVRSRTPQHPPSQRGISFRPRRRHPTSTPTRLATRKIYKCCRPVPDSHRQSVTARLRWGGGAVQRQGLANLGTLAVTVRLPRRAWRVACRRHIYSSATLSLCL